MRRENGLVSYVESCTDLFLVRRTPLCPLSPPSPPSSPRSLPSAVDVAINLICTLPIFLEPENYIDGTSEQDLGETLIEWYHDFASLASSMITLIAGLYMRDRLLKTGAIDSGSKEKMINKFNQRIAIIVICNILNTISSFAIYGYFGSDFEKW